MADAADRCLPARFRALCRELLIRVTDFPTEEALGEMDIDDEFGIPGLFSGIGLPDAPCSDRTTSWDAVHQQMKRSSD